MFHVLLKKIVGSKNERELKRLSPIVAEINALEPEVRKLSDSEFAGRTAQFKERLAKGEALEQLLPEAFALVREAARRTLGERHFDVQLMGGIVLHEGIIAEMKTGEGKTLVSTLPIYLNALLGRGAHLVTVNDYLARRDADWMGPIYRLLGLGVGAIQHDMDDQERKAAYACDVTYGTNNEFGFDSLRANMKFSMDDYVQRELFYAIVDEVDSILIDEARTPLIISGPTEESVDTYHLVNGLIPELKKARDFSVEEKSRTIALTEEGVGRLEKLVNVDNLYDSKCIELLHHIDQGLKAHHLFKRDVDYVVKDNQVIIVDEFTGRMMPGRRYSDGLHQALEAKEKVKIENENQTLAAITFQNYFRMYKKLAGMTGTADTEAVEFNKIYKLDVVVIPTNVPMIRLDNPDVIYRTEKEKFNAVADGIEECHKRGQPILIGTLSIEKSEYLSRLLKRRGIAHEVLNAKNHEKEAQIIAEAGQFGGVTVSTNMAGRGVDIKLGPGVVEVGGLHIVGTERHESRRIDNQLRGRSGRQGDSGSSRFYLSLEDELLRIFGSDKISGIMSRLGMEEGVPIEHNLVSKAIEGAQAKVEGHNFDIRKHLLEYDDVMNQQRHVIYEQRRRVLSDEGRSDIAEGMIDEVAEEMVDTFAPEKTHPDEWNLAGLKEAWANQFGQELDLDPDAGQIEDRDQLSELLISSAKMVYEGKTAEIGKSLMKDLEKLILLQAIDYHWKDHLLNMDHLKEGIGLRGYGQRDPLQEYKREGYEMFTDLTERIKSSTVERLFKVQLADPEEVDRPQREQRFVLSRGESKPRQATIRQGKKIGRNEPCPCGSGKKYKRCCGAA
ncbi:MAG: preprotein translocase subunit SecA [Thermodesulfobacteriota bacterium]